MEGNALEHARRAMVPDLSGILDAVLQEVRFDSSAEPTVCVLGDVAGRFTARLARRLPNAAITRGRASNPIDSVRSSAQCAWSTIRNRSSRQLG